MASKPLPEPKQGMLLVSRELLESLVDDSDCWFDHHGGCQAHGYLSLQPGELCPQNELKILLAPLRGEISPMQNFNRIIVQYDGFDGKPYYQCGCCYQLSLTAAAPQTTMSMPPKIPPPPGTKCSSCGVLLADSVLMAE